MTNEENNQSRSDQSATAKADPRIGERGVTRHTPGPWKVYDDGEMWVAPVDANQPIVCDIRPSGDEFVYALLDDANAHLIAAAPDLLDAAVTLKAFLGLMLEEEGLSERYSKPWINYLRAAYKQAETALAKAEGREP